MTHIAKALKEEHLSDKKEFLQNELKSLGIVEHEHVQNKFNDKLEELQALAENIKSVYYQAYKTAYSSNNNSSSLGNIPMPSSVTKSMVLYDPSVTLYSPESLRIEPTTKTLQQEQSSTHEEE